MPAALKSARSVGRFHARYVDASCNQTSPTTRYGQISRLASAWQCPMVAHAPSQAARAEAWRRLVGAMNSACSMPPMRVVRYDIALIIKCCEDIRIVVTFNDQIARQAT